MLELSLLLPWDDIFVMFSVRDGVKDGEFPRWIYEGTGRSGKCGEAVKMCVLMSVYGLLLD